MVLVYYMFVDYEKKDKDEELLKKAEARHAHRPTPLQYGGTRPNNFSVVKAGSSHTCKNQI